MPNYPTKEEILENLYTPTEAEYNAVRRWKRERYNKQWKTYDIDIKMTFLQELIQSVLRAREIPQAQWPTIIATEHPWSFSNPVAGPSVINMGLDRPSIVSALHELGHYLHFNDRIRGPIAESELIACQYSIGIFSRCFPKSYEKLSWDGHTLTARNENVEKND